MAAQAILYLRPQKQESIAALDLEANEPFRDEVAPPPEPTDIPVEGFTPTSHLSPHDGHDEVSRESTPGLYSICPRVFRLGFDSVEHPSARGFTFGLAPDSVVKLPYYGKNEIKEANYFRIHYNFNSGALLITAMDRIRIGTAILGKAQSLHLMADTKIECGGVFDFIVEFPNLSNCAEEHKQNYLEYAKKFGIHDAQYMATPREGYPPIGAEHRSIAILGNGTFGEVHKAVNVKNGEVFAIKKLSGKEDELEEVKILSRLRHENIIKYEYAFQLPTGQICIAMELAVNDLQTHLDARKNGRGKPYLLVQCIQSIGHQALSGVEYLHFQGVMHRDLKPKNILVTKWDAATDIPNIKLADFGLAAIGPEHKTFCGTKGYVAPEVKKVNDMLKKLKKQKDKGMKTIPRNQLLIYTNAVDIWPLGKILKNLVDDIPSRISLHRGKTALVDKTLALSLVDQMMQEDPKDRPTAAKCLKHPWMRNYSFITPIAKKRDRPLFNRALKRPFKRIVQFTLGNSTTTSEGSTLIMRKAMWSQESSEYQDGVSASDLEMQDPSVDRDSSQASSLRIRIGDDGRLLATTQSDEILDSPVPHDEGIPQTILPDSTSPQGESPSMKAVARRLLAALQSEGYGNNVHVAGHNATVGVVRDELSQLSISSLQVREDSENVITKDLELMDGSSWKELQSPVNRSIGARSARLIEGNAAAADEDYSRPISRLQVQFSQVCPPSFLDHPFFDQPVGHPNELPLPTITGNDGQMRGSLSDFGASFSSNGSKGNTYPSDYDDIL